MYEHNKDLTNVFPLLGYHANQTIISEILYYLIIENIDYFFFKKI